MSYNGSGTFVINSAGQPVVTGTVISSTAFNALTADLATGLSTAITKDGQTTTTSRILFAQGISSTLVTDATSTTTGSIITAGGISTQKALWVGTTTTLAGALTYGGVTLSNSVTGTGSMVLSAGPTLTGTAAGQTNNAASETAWTVLNNSASNGAFAILRGSNGTSSVDFGMTGTGYAGVGAYIANQAYVRCDAANGFGIYAPTGPIKFVGSGFSEVARFDTSGRLGIGMTPSNILDITQSSASAATISILNSNAGVNSSTDVAVGNGTCQGIMRLHGSSYTTSGINRQNGIRFVSTGVGGLTLEAAGSGIMYFAIQNNEVARFDSGGSLCIASTSSYGGYKLSATTNGGAIAIFVNIDTGGSSQSSVVFQRNGSNVGSISTSSTATSYNTSSDARLKTNVSDAAPASALIDAIQVRQFDWKVDNSHQRYGMVAQELVEVAPEAVNVPTDPEEMMGVDYSKLVPMMIKTIQELTTRLAALESK